MFGQKMEDAFAMVGQAADALRGKPAPRDDTAEDDGETNINININS